MICRPKRYFPHFLILFFTTLVPLFLCCGFLPNKQPTANYFPPVGPGFAISILKFGISYTVIWVTLALCSVTGLITQAQLAWQGSTL